MLAQQAYNFNKTYSGYPYDNDIYNGLFAALKNFNNPLTQSLAGHDKGAARALVTRSTNANIYSGGSDGRVLRWSNQNNVWVSEELAQLTDYQIYAMDISPDGSALAVGGLYPVDRDANYVLLYDLNTPGAEPKKITGYKSDVENISFTPDGKGFYARCNSGYSIMYSDLSTSKEVVNSKEKITSVDLSPDGTKLAGAGVQGNLYIWDIRNNYAGTSYPIIKERNILAVAFLPDSRGVVLGDEYGIVRIVDSGVVRRTLSGHTSQIEQIKFSFSGQFMATASKDGTVRLWNLKALNEQPQVLSDHTWVWSVAFTQDDRQLVAGLHNKEETVEGVNEAIHAWPTQILMMADELCKKVKQNMTKEDWVLYMRELPYELTCPNLPANNK